MRSINISDSRKRDAEVSLESRPARREINYVQQDGEAVKNTKVIKGTVATSLPSLIKAAGSLEDVADLLIEGDPEVDLGITGRRLGPTQRVYLKEDGEISYTLRKIDIVHTPDGEVKETRDHVDTEANIAEEIPVRWTGKLMPKERVVNKFVFSRKYQLTHVNGLTYDFLYAMAKELDDKSSLLFLAAGPKGRDPLILQRGGKPYRAFLEGRVDGDKYALIMHLTNLELKELVA